MKRIYNYIMFAAFSVAIASCNNEELDPSTPSAESGDEVQFGLTLGDPETKTVYGDEANDAFPIYWINGDKVQIFSPQCLDGRRSAEYEVSVSTPQNYADALNKTGEYGVQWGNSENAIFYSLYPSGAYTLSSDGKEAQGITINYSQNIVVNGNEVKSDMEDCLMYAKNDGGEENEHKGVQRGQTVNLKYTPISTVFMVTLKVASSSADDFTIQSVSLVAPTGTDIAGTFSLNISNGSFGKFADDKSSNTVSTQISDKATPISSCSRQMVSIPLSSERIVVTLSKISILKHLLYCIFYLVVAFLFGLYSRDKNAIVGIANVHVFLAELILKLHINVSILFFGTPADTGNRFFHGNVKEKGDIGFDDRPGNLIDPFILFKASGPEIGKTGIKVPVAEDNLAFFHFRYNYLADML